MGRPRPPHLGLAQATTYARPMVPGPRTGLRVPWPGLEVPWLGPGKAQAGDDEEAQGGLRGGLGRA